MRVARQGQSQGLRRRGESQETDACTYSLIFPYSLKVEETDESILH